MRCTMVQPSGGARCESTGGLPESAAMAATKVLAAWEHRMVSGLIAVLLERELGWDEES